jgi:thiol-disulfide isomerase/thioredoxin
MRSKGHFQKPLSHFDQKAKCDEKNTSHTPLTSAALTSTNSAVAKHKTGFWKCPIVFMIFVALLSVAATSSKTATMGPQAIHCSPCDTLNPQLQNSAGDVQLVVDSSITKLEKSMRGFRDIKGYRVQIFLGTAEAVKTERNKYLALGLPYSAYMKQVVPEYSLVIGDFSTRMELEKNLQIIQQHYPKAFVVNDVIEMKAKK